MRKFDLSLRSSRSSYFATFRHQLTILSKTDALDEEIGRAVQQECRDRKSGSAGMPRPISYAVFCLKKKKKSSTSRSPKLQANREAPLSDAPSTVASPSGSPGPYLVQNRSQSLVWCSG